MSYDAGAPSGDDLFLIKGNSSYYGEVIWSTKPYGGVSGGGGYGDQCLVETEDISGDGLPDLLLGTGEVIWQQFIGTVVMKVEPITDVNSDGIEDLLVGSWDNEIICLDGATGGLLWHTPTGALNEGDVWTIFPIDDIDGDRVDNVLAGSFDTKIYCVSGSDGDILWTYTTGSRLLTVRSIPDVNGDGLADPDTGVVYSGESFSLTVTVENTTSYPQTTDAWIDVRLPGGRRIPFMIEHDVTLPAGISASPHLEIDVPLIAPSGVYRVFVSVGDHGLTVVDSDSFDIEVVNSGAAADVSENTAWLLTGKSRNNQLSAWIARLDSGREAAHEADRHSPEETDDILCPEEQARLTDEYIEWAVENIGSNTCHILKARRMRLGPDSKE